MSTSASQLERIRTTLQTRIMLTNWGGADAGRFRQLWDSQLRGLLNSVEGELRAVGDRLTAEATQQDDASRDPGLGGTAFLAASGLSWLFTIPDTVHGSADGLLKGVKKGFIHNVERKVTPYERWARNHASTLKRMFGTTKDVEHDLRFLSRAGVAFAVIGAGIDMVDQYQKDSSGHYSEGERLSRAYEAGALPAVVSFVGTELAVDGGVLVGFALGGPVGAVIGGVAGYAIATAGTTYFHDDLQAIGADLGSLEWKANSAVVDFGAKALERSADLLKDGEHELADVRTVTTHAVSSVTKDVEKGAAKALHWVMH